MPGSFSTGRKGRYPYYFCPQRPEYARLFREIVVEVRVREGAEAESRLSAIRKRIEDVRLSWRHLRSTYQEQDGELDAELMAAKLDESEGKADELDSGVLLFAERVLTKAHRLCSEFNLDQKKRLQRVLFPEGLRVAHGRLETAAISSIFAVLPEFTPLSMPTAVRVTGTPLPVSTIVIVCAVEGNGENIRE